MSRNKKRLLYGILIILTVPLGLATRTYGHHFPLLMHKYGGDALYATNIFFVLRFIFPNGSLWKVAVAAYCICICIETLQLYQAPWMQALRHTPPFGTILGYGFLWSDLVCYAAGVLSGLFISTIAESIIFAGNAKPVNHPPHSSRSSF